MTRDLPTGFHDWPEDAKREFLLQARNRADMMDLICDAVGVDNDTDAKGGRIHQKTIVEVYLALLQICD